MQAKTAVSLFYVTRTFTNNVTDLQCFERKNKTGEKRLINNSFLYQHFLLDMVFSVTCFSKYKYLTFQYHYFLVLVIFSSKNNLCFDILAYGMYMFQMITMTRLNFCAKDNQIIFFLFSPLLIC